MDDKTLPKKLDDNPQYAAALRDFLKAERKKLGGTKALYLALYGVEPAEKEEQRLINLLNRGALSGEFIGLCVDKLGLADRTLGDAFDIKKGR
ncbi:hypothetical protein [Pseudoalteromonas peptidolytica]|uniref:Uncharacterized protein n=1 Tax=Pseudoalteromonas peptidolytica F12-50-A1 TaxID=1315280 RepID=A0A8I0T6A5_9GAMM|nr:hypothetical protein [Pseudoalteromonas peptidolytica]MBE0348227.1 hypothetical protein [Pseudoalteromonas peptidolytica F12-50-A1]NLR16590.1 hypothetical protein [Pseudoalteromonas peptidolytica]GEK11888.1 hypothetical protein PPE03_41370 [Pseudoalteromonas peptidolytica]